VSKSKKSINYLTFHLRKSIIYLTFGITKEGGMKSSELLRLLKRAGWYEVSQQGSHIKLRHPDRTNQITFPNHGSKEMAKGTELAIKKQAGL
jgi:predicted RNA binding protein YcfA (HicA-like mRNA interferase family)